MDTRGRSSHLIERSSGSGDPASGLAAPFWVEEGKLRWRSNDTIPPSALLISSPYDTQAHLAIKRDTVWTGYKVHLTETCDEQSPHLIIHVETTPATTQDIHLTNVIHQELEHKHLLPSEHLMDTGYVDGEHIVTSQKLGIELIGPVTIPGNWQVVAAQGFDISHFQIDWEHKTVTCPTSERSVANGQNVRDIGGLI